MTEQTATTTAPAVHPVTIDVMVRVQALAIREADGRYSVIVPALPGCVTQGDSIEEAHANAVEVTELWLDCQHDHRKADALKTVLE